MNKAKPRSKKSKPAPKSKPIDPRLHLDRLVDDITDPENDAAHETQWEIMENVLGAVRWYALDPATFKSILHTLYDAAIPELKEAMVEHAIDEHRGFCMCCKRAAEVTP